MDVIVYAYQHTSLFPGDIFGNILLCYLIFLKIKVTVWKILTDWGIVMKNVWRPLTLLAWKSLCLCWLGVLCVKFPVVWLIYIYTHDFLFALMHLFVSWVIRELSKSWTSQWMPRDVWQQQRRVSRVPGLHITSLPATPGPSNIPLIHCLLAIDYVTIDLFSL